MMKCPYCLDPFDIEIKVPIKLRCSHSFCKECIEILENTLNYCPIDYIKVDYSQSETNQDILNDLNFNCPQHGSHCIGVCFDHSCPICEECEKVHSECLIFEGTRNNIAVKMQETVDLAIKNKIICQKGNSSSFNMDDIVESVESHLKTLDILSEKFEKNLLTQKEKEKFFNYIQPLSKIKEALYFEECNQSLNIPNFDLNDKNLDLNSQNLDLISQNPNLKGLNFDFSGFNFDFTKMINDLNITDPKIELELNLVNLNHIPIFKQITTNDKNYEHYFCYFRQTVANYVIVTGCGFGIPSFEGGFIDVSCFEIRVNDEKYSEDIGVIEFLPERLTTKIKFQNSIILQKNTEMYFHIEIDGTSNYLFKIFDSNSITLKNVEGKPYSESFPILYLIIE